MSGCGLDGNALVSISLMERCLRMGFFAGRATCADGYARAETRSSATLEDGEEMLFAMGFGLGGGDQSTAVWSGP